MRPSRPKRIAGKLLLVYCLVCAAAVSWPGYALVGDRLEPFVLGLPFCFAWNVGWVLLTFVSLLAFHLTTGERD